LLLADQHVRGADAAAAHHVAEAGAGVGNLTLAGRAAQLMHGLPDLGEAGRAARMAARDEAAVGRERRASAGLEPAFLDRLLALALAAEAEQLVVLELLDHERIVHLDEIDVARPEARLLPEVRGAVAAHLRRADDRAHEEVPALVLLRPQV